MNNDDFKKKNEELVKFLIQNKFLKTKRLITAFKKIPRHIFVPQQFIDYAYDDLALPITKNSTISQPSTVATMLELIQPKKNEKILEIGTGSGWQASLLAYIVGRYGKIITLDINKKVIEFATNNIKKTNLKNIKIIYRDGSYGYKDAAPYNKIIYTAAVSNIPNSVIQQLKINGVLIAPFGNKYFQTLKLIKRDS
ncbi:MAG: protein-L-isoaspartate(D-aspartate) O-methyltransferase, partial [Candidatus Micrarchaeia archaeon]